MPFSSSLYHSKLYSLVFAALLLSQILYLFRRYLS
nr:MAG TPA: hypothetical protein [Caudoviricetes sp.]